MNLFNHISVLAVHQRALLIEKQLGRRSNSGLAIGTGSNTSGVNRGASSSGLSQCASGSGTSQRAPPIVSQSS